jgi:hypothetical protein
VYAEISFFAKRPTRIRQDLFKLSFIKVLQECYILAKHKTECPIFTEFIFTSQGKLLYLQPNSSRVITLITHELIKMGAQVTTLPVANKNLNTIENNG